jgi:hypothetical protein
MLDSHNPDAHDNFDSLDETFPHRLRHRYEVESDETVDHVLKKFGKKSQSAMGIVIDASYTFIHHSDNLWVLHRTDDPLARNSA